MESCLAEAIQLAEGLKAKNLKLVFAESCTAGRLAATMGQIPGISNLLCGSFVVYRNASKSKWLEIDHSLLNDPSVGPVSALVTRLLAESALIHTPESQVALAITGDIGPGVLPEKDGRVFCCVKFRGVHPLESSTRLEAAPPKDTEDFKGRIARLDETTRWAFQFLSKCLSS